MLLIWSMFMNILFPLPQPPERREADNTIASFKFNKMSSAPVKPPKPPKMVEKTNDETKINSVKNSSVKRRFCGNESVCSQDKLQPTSLKKATLNKETKPQNSMEIKDMSSDEKIKKARVVKTEPSMPKNVKKNHFARHFSFVKQVPVDEATETIESVENEIRNLCEKGRKVDFADGHFTCVQKPPTLKKVSVPNSDDVSHYVVDKHSILYHRNKDARKLGVPFWPVKLAANGDVSLDYSGRKIDVSTFKPTKEDLKNAFSK